MLGTVTESDHQQALVCCWENDHVTPPSVGRSTKNSNFVDCHRPQLATVSKLQLKQTNSVVACLLQPGNMQLGVYWMGVGGCRGKRKVVRNVCLHLFAVYVTTPSAG